MAFFWKGSTLLSTLLYLSIFENICWLIDNIWIFNEDKMEWIPTRIVAKRGHCKGILLVGVCHSSNMLQLLLMLKLMLILPSLLQLLLLLMHFAMFFAYARASTICAYCVKCTLKFRPLSLIARFIIAMNGAIGFYVLFRKGREREMLTHSKFIETKFSATLLSVCRDQNEDDNVDSGSLQLVVFGSHFHQN